MQSKAHIKIKKSFENHRSRLDVPNPAHIYIYIYIYIWYMRVDPKQEYILKLRTPPTQALFGEIILNDSSVRPQTGL